MKKWLGEDNNRKKQELVIGGHLICIDLSNRTANFSGGPFVASFKLDEETEKEMKHEIIRKSYLNLQHNLELFKHTALNMGVELE